MTEPKCATCEHCGYAWECDDGSEHGECLCYHRALAKPKCWPGAYIGDDGKPDTAPAWCPRKEKGE